MKFKITKTNKRKMFITAESWLDLLWKLNNDVVKVERLDYDKSESEDKK